ncbi:MAG: DoxX family protein [Acidobacteriota bacterium]|nr:DoxX family protein [Acidobacteriota bacterium]
MRTRQPGRFLMGALYIAAGTLHFLITRRYVAIMPPYLPAPRELVLISGAAEIAGGLGVLAPGPTIRHAAAWGLVALLIAVMPANINMALNQTAFPAIPAWLLWIRLPLQIPLLYWAWIYTRNPTQTTQYSTKAKI